MKLLSVIEIDIIIFLFPSLKILGYLIICSIYRFEKDVLQSTAKYFFIFLECVTVSSLLNDSYRFDDITFVINRDFLIFFYLTEKGIEKVLELLKLLHGVKVKIHQDSIIKKGKQCRLNFSVS